MTSTQPLDGKVIALTGAASGIGLATAHYLAQRGASLSLADIQQKGLDELQKSLRELYNAQVLITKTDVSKGEDVDKWIKSTISTFGRLDGAAKLAGVFIESTENGGLAQIDDDTWNLVIAVNLTGMMNCLRAQLQVISEGGSIVTASSVAGILGSSQFPAYSASKHGVIGLSKSAAREAGARQVRVNVVVPGQVDTPMNTRAAQLVTRAEYTAKRPIERPAIPEEIAALVAFLLGDESRYITGSVYVIDGGRTC